MKSPLKKLNNLYLTPCRNGRLKPDEAKTYLIENRRSEVQIKNTNKSNNASSVNSVNN